MCCDPVCYFIKLEPGSSLWLSGSINFLRLKDIQVNKGARTTGRIMYAMKCCYFELGAIQVYCWYPSTEPFPISLSLELWSEEHATFQSSKFRPILLCCTNGVWRWVNRRVQIAFLPFIQNKCDQHPIMLTFLRNNSNRGLYSELHSCPTPYSKRYPDIFSMR